MTRLTPSDDVKKYDRCLRVKDLHRDAGVKVETLVKQPDTNKMLTIKLCFWTVSHTVSTEA